MFEFKKVSTDTLRVAIQNTAEKMGVNVVIVEKATILHHEANRPSNLKIPTRYARHYYDMYQIANSEYKDKAFSDVELLEKVATFKSKFYC